MTTWLAWLGLLVVGCGLVLGGIMRALTWSDTVHDMDVAGGTKLMAVGCVLVVVSVLGMAWRACQ